MATSGIIIEKGVPITRLPQPERSTYPFSDMEVGDSFFVPNKKSNQLGNFCSYQRLKTGRRFSVRTVEGGARIWRIA